MPLNTAIAEQVRSLENILERGKRADPALWDISQLCIELADTPIAPSMPGAVIITQARTSPGSTE